MKSFWVDTACKMEESQAREYQRIESTLDFAAKELLKRGSMKLLGTMLATTLGWPDFCHAEWAMDDDLVKAINGAADDPDTPQPPALLGQSFLKHFDHKTEGETLVLTLKETGETDRVPLYKDGGVYHLDVTFNGKHTRRFIYDTGAYSVSIPPLMAAEIGLEITKSDKEVTVGVADGRTAKAKEKKIGSVKVGKLSVSDVLCTVKVPGSDVHTVGYWDKPKNKDIKNWCGVVTPKPIGDDTVYPKEQALVDICKLHKRAGHQTWVYCQMTGKRNVMPRLKAILSREGLKVGIMRSDDVEPKEREEWIAKNGREFDVMICFPKLVSTGLDLFSKVQGGHNYNCIVFYETGYKLNEMRQAARRAWRIGQPRDCYIYYLYYQETMQHRAMSLMSRKMAAALALEGEFSEEGLAALSGEGDEQMALAKSMSEKIDDADMQRSWSKVKSAERRSRQKKQPRSSLSRSCPRTNPRVRSTRSRRPASCSHARSWSGRSRRCRSQPRTTSSPWPSTSPNWTPACGLRPDAWPTVSLSPSRSPRRWWSMTPTRWSRPSPSPSRRKSNRISTASRTRRTAASATTSRGRWSSPPTFPPRSPSPSRRCGPSPRPRSRSSRSSSPSLRRRCTPSSTTSSSTTH